MVTLVAGPCCSGKTTFARSQGGDVLDWDDVYEELTGLPRYMHHVTPPPLVVESAFRQRAFELTDGWIVRAVPSKRTRAMLRRLWNCAVVVLETPAEVCLERMRADRPEETWHSHALSIQSWWARYERSTSGQERWLAP